MFFSILHSYLDKTEKATLRLASKKLRDDNLDVRSIAAVLVEDCESINFSRVVPNLPNLKSIDAGVSFSSSGLINILQAAQLARRLTKLELRSSEKPLAQSVTRY
jgi:hypothetical protein